MNIDLFEMNSLIMILGVLAAILGFCMAIYGIASWFISKKKIANRLDYYVTSEVEPEEGPTNRPIIAREISGSLFSRTLSSWITKCVKYLGRFTPEKMTHEIEHKLAIAGHPYDLHAGEFYALRFLVLLIGPVLAFLINRDFKNVDMTSLLLGILVILICFMLPDVWLKGRMRSRQDEIRRMLPDALDMLSVCASAGLGFDQSMQKISHNWNTELAYEFQRVIQEMEMGVSRGEALKNMSHRLEVDDLSRFVAILVQAEKVGMSYAEVLHSQASQLRVLRQFRAREIANKLPAKMILPLALFIFPAIIAVILGPSIPVLFSLF